MFVITFIILWNLYRIECFNSNDSETPPPPSPQLIGSNKCTWGPSFWCASKENAEMCNYDYTLCH